MVYIDMNKKLRKEAKSEFEKDFFKLMNNSVLGKIMENVRKHRGIKLVTREEKIIKLVSEPNYHRTKNSSDNLLAIEMKKTKVKMNKPVYLGMSILDISKTLMYEFYYDYVKPTYKDKAKLCYMDTDSVVITKHNKSWSYTPDHPYRILIKGGSGSGKTNVLWNLIENQPDTDKIYLYAKGLYEAKYQYLINKREDVGINPFNDPKASVKYLNDMHNVYKNIDDYSPDKESKILIVFDDKSYDS